MSDDGVIYTGCQFTARVHLHQRVDITPIRPQELWAESTVVSDTELVRQRTETKILLKTNKKLFKFVRDGEEKKRRKDKQPEND